MTTPVVPSQNAKQLGILPPIVKGQRLVTGAPLAATEEPWARDIRRWSVKNEHQVECRSVKNRAGFDFASVLGEMLSMHTYTLLPMDDTGDITLTNVTLMLMFGANGP